MKGGKTPTFLSFFSFQIIWETNVITLNSFLSLKGKTAAAAASPGSAGAQLLGAAALPLTAVGRLPGPDRGGAGLGCGAAEAQLDVGSALRRHVRLRLP